MEKKKILLCFDSFKGSITARDACRSVAGGLKKASADYEITEVPMADGGEGTLDCLKQCTTAESVFCNTVDALGNKLPAEYLIDDKKAYFETAKTCGLEQKSNLARPITERLSYGLGLQIQDAIHRGCKEFFVGLGGSCTNDAGIGLLQALGVEFLNAADKNIPLKDIADLAIVQKIDFSCAKILSPQYSLTLLSDVSNPLLGENGSTAVYGPQKGASPEQISQIEAQFEKLLRLTTDQNSEKISRKKGTGAAGGLGFALLLAGGKIQNGAKFLMEIIELETKIRDADFILTGEGKTDSQTLQGKLPLIVADLCKLSGKNVFLLSAVYDPEILEKILSHFQGCFSILPKIISSENAIETAERLLFNAGRNLGEVLKLLR